jgi:ABC-type nitrate/sulfonate/bicarbonate transport system ATPase subunit
MRNPYLKINKISKRYTDKVGYNINLLKDISLSVNSNQFITILAPVGSGKTSLLKILAGLDSHTEGEIKTDFKNRVFIPSLPSSFPWLSVGENIRFNSKFDESRLNEIINLIGLYGYEDHFPHNKSEGFRFRISLGRALANDPDVIIMDEPFNTFNTSTRREIYTLVGSIAQLTSISFILGTTNITEAIYLSDKVYLMKKNPGEIIDELKINLPDDRNHNIMDTDEFISIRSKIENVFKDRADRVLYNFSI